MASKRKSTLVKFHFYFCANHSAADPDVALFLVVQIFIPDRGLTIVCLPERKNGSNSFEH